MPTLSSLIKEPTALHRFINEEMKQRYERLCELKKKKISASVGVFSPSFLSEEPRNWVDDAANIPKGVCNKKACRQSSFRRPESLELRNLRSRKTIHNLLLHSWRHRKKDKKNETHHGTDS